MNKKKATNPTSKLRSFLLFLLCTIVVGVVLLMAFSTKPTPSAEDIRYINAFLKEWGINTTPANVHASFEKEIEFIRSVQDSVVSRIKHQEIEQNQYGNVRFYYQNRYGFCYDRVILMEKIFLYFNFNIRHVFVYYSEDTGTPEETTLSHFFKKGTGSHALTEVKTSKGWMVIGSNADWMGVDEKGQPFTIRELKKNLYQTGVVPLTEQPLHGMNFWEQRAPRFRYIYGVYSRHGHFLPPYNAVPDYNFRMLLYNF